MIERVSFYMRDDLSTARNLDVIDKETVHSVARSRDPPVTQETIIRGPSVLQNGVNDMVPHPRRDIGWVTVLGLQKPVDLLIDVVSSGHAPLRAGHIEQEPARSLILCCSTESRIGDYSPQMTHKLISRGAS